MDKNDMFKQNGYHGNSFIGLCPRVNEIMLCSGHIFTTTLCENLLKGLVSANQQSLKTQIIKQK